LSFEKGSAIKDVERNFFKAFVFVRANRQFLDGRYSCGVWRAWLASEFSSFVSFFTLKAIPISALNTLFIHVGPTDRRHLPLGSGRRRRRRGGGPSPHELSFERRRRQGAGADKRALFAIISEETRNPRTLLPFLQIANSPLLPLFSRRRRRRRFKAEAVVSPEQKPEPEPEPEQMRPPDRDRFGAGKERVAKERP